MARYIDADKIHYPVDKSETNKTNWHYGILYMKDTIDRQPTADVVEVKHGEWLDNHNGTFVCSVCRGKSPRKRWCGDCGAKMDGGKAE